MFYLLKQSKLAKRLGKITGQLPLLFWDEKKRSEQPQGDFFAQISLQREPCNLGGQFYWWRKAEYPEKTTDRSL